MLRWTNCVLIYVLFMYPVSQIIAFSLEPPLVHTHETNRSTLVVRYHAITLWFGLSCITRPVAQTIQMKLSPLCRKDPMPLLTMANQKININGDMRYKLLEVSNLQIILVSRTLNYW